MSSTITGPANRSYRNKPVPVTRIWEELYGGENSIDGATSERYKLYKELLLVTGVSME